MRTTYEEFLTGDADDREMDREDAIIEAERGELAAAKAARARERGRDETPHLPEEWP